MTFTRLPPNDCRELMVAQDVTILDIRDRQAFNAGHIDQAIHIDEIDVEQFIEEQTKDTPLVICCYHGHSSQSAAAYFADKGFTNVYSLEGGYVGWEGAG